MSDDKLVFVGTIVSPKNLFTLSITKGFIAVSNGKIESTDSLDKFEVLNKSGAFSDYKVIRMNEDQFLMPGFVDCHTHAPQFPNIGLGLDRPLLQWLDKYTFPLESKYHDVEFASKVYDIVVKRLIANGTTTACYFGSLHLEGTLKLVESVIKHGQRALVGKVSMNIENNAGYFNDTIKELKETEEFIRKVLAFNNDLVAPAVTPRFAVSCDRTLMEALCDLSKKYGCFIQSHISENIAEIEHVLTTNPYCATYAEVYDKCGLLNERCIMAHAVHSPDEEINLLASRGVSIAHCPASNTRLRSGLCPVKKLINKGIEVGLGTDVAGGDSSSILDAMRRAVDVSIHLQFQGKSDTYMDWKEAFYLATLGGAKALRLSDKIGSLEAGKEFDALLVDVYPSTKFDPQVGPIDHFDYEPLNTFHERAEETIQRFIHLADDRNIVQVYVKGRKLKDVLRAT